MYRLRVDAQTYTICDADPEDQWDRGEYGLDLRVLGLYRKPSDAGGWGFDAFRAIDHEDDISVGDLAYVVIAHYRTGDTFGSSETYSVVGVYADPDRAEAVRDHPERLRCRLWEGYFEDLNWIEVFPLVVQ